MPPTRTPGSDKMTTGSDLGGIPKPEKLEKHPVKRTSLALFESHVGGRAAIRDLLTFGALTTEVQSLIGLLRDPLRAGDSLHALCIEAGVPPVTLLALIRDAAFARGFTEASLVVADRLSDVTRDVAAKAVDRLGPCPSCHGQPPGANQPACSRCQGTGEILIESDLERQKLMLQAGGLVKTGGGRDVHIQTQIGLNVSGEKSFFASFVKTAAETLQTSPPSLPPPTALLEGTLLHDTPGDPDPAGVPAGASPHPQDAGAE